MSNILLFLALGFSLRTTEPSEVVIDENTTQIEEVATDTDVTTEELTEDDVMQMVEYNKDKSDGYLTDIDSYEVAPIEEVERYTFKWIVSWVGFGLFFTFAKQIKDIFSYWTKNRKDV